MIDIAVIGGGPAGLTAALYAARAGKTVTVFEREGFGGQITHTSIVENYPGTGRISGMELGDRMCQQAEAAGAELSFSGVQNLAQMPDGAFSLETEDGPVTARAVIYAAGAIPRALGLPGESELVGSGVSYCAICDGGFFADQEVAVEGGGSAAFSDALLLSEVCRSVTLLHRRSEFRAEQILVEQAKRLENLHIRTDTTVRELISAEGALKGVAIETGDGCSETLPVTGLFVTLGRIPDTKLVSSLAELDGNGYIVTDADMKTAVPGLYAAGDCRSKDIRQLTTAVSDGTVAALSACRWLRNG